MIWSLSLSDRPHQCQERKCKWRRDDKWMSVKSLLCPLTALTARVPLSCATLTPLEEMKALIAGLSHNYRHNYFLYKSPQIPMPDYQIRAFNKLPAVCMCDRECFLQYSNTRYHKSIHPSIHPSIQWRALVTWVVWGGCPRGQFYFKPYLVFISGPGRRALSTVYVFLWK